MSGNRPKGKKPPAPKAKLTSNIQPGVLSKSGNSNRWKKTGQHIYRYHPPRTDYPLLQSAQPAVQLATVPKSVDLRILCPPIRAQGKEEACSGFATAAFREASYVAKTGVLLPDYLSPAYLYGWTRINDGIFPTDSAATPPRDFPLFHQPAIS